MAGLPQPLTGAPAAAAIQSWNAARACTNLTAGPSTSLTTLHGETVPFVAPPAPATTTTTTSPSSSTNGGGTTTTTTATGSSGAGSGGTATTTTTATAVDDLDGAPVDHHRPDRQRG